MGAESDTPVAASAASNGNGQAAASPAAPQSLTEFAVEHARQMVGDGSNGQPAPAAAQPAAPAEATPEFPVPKALEQAQTGGPAAGEPAAVLSRWGIDAAGLPAEAAGALAQTLATREAEQRDWHAKASEWAAGVKQRYEESTAINQRWERVVSDPRFQQALQAVLGGSAGGAEKPPEFETDAERRLWTELQQVKQFNQGLLGQVRERFDAINEQLRSGTQAAQRAEQSRIVGELRTIHSELDTHFPALARDEASLRRWHEKAAAIMEAQAANGGIDLRDALLEAAYILDYRNARDSGATRAMQMARRAAASSTMRDRGGRPEGGEGPAAGEDLASFGRRRLAAHLQGAG